MCPLRPSRDLPFEFAPPLSPATPCAQVVTHDPRAGSRTSGRACGNSPHELGRVRAAYRCFSSPERDRFGVLSAGLRLLLASLPQVNVHGPMTGSRTPGGRSVHELSRVHDHRIARHATADQTRKRIRSSTLESRTVGPASTLAFAPLPSDQSGIEPDSRFGTGGVTSLAMIFAHYEMHPNPAPCRARADDRCARVRLESRKRAKSHSGKCATLGGLREFPVASRPCLRRRSEYG